MSDHPCPLPRKRRWLRGRRWTCACGRKYWLLEADDAGTYYDNLRFLDDGPDWQWVGSLTHYEAGSADG